MPSFRDRQGIAAAKATTVTVTPEMWRQDCYLAVGFDGKHGAEGAYAVAEMDGKLISFPSRAPSYNANVWECDAYYSMNSWEGYTYYLPISEDMIGREIKVYALFMNEGQCDMPVDIRLCDANNEKKGIIVNL